AVRDGILTTRVITFLHDGAAPRPSTPTCTDNDVIFRKPDLKRRREADNVRIFRVDVSSRQAPPVPLPCFPTYRPGHRRGTLHPRSSHRPSLSQTRRNTGRKRAPSFRLWFPPYRHFMAATPAVDPTAAHTSHGARLRAQHANACCGRTQPASTRHMAGRF
ncbi:hypothetical protein Bbelb_385680, partial [Branchiostoma belcheri]